MEVDLPSTWAIVAHSRTADALPQSSVEDISGLVGEQGRILPILCSVLPAPGRDSADRRVFLLLDVPCSRMVHCEFLLLTDCIVADAVLQEGCTCITGLG